MQSKKPLRVKTSLKSNKPLKSKTILSASKTPKKQKKPPITLLRRKADKLFSRYVRLRDSSVKDGEFWGTCITCSFHRQVAWVDDKNVLRYSKGWDAGHYIGRGNLFLRFEEENVNLQDSFRCNRMRSGEHEKYKLALDMKYGGGTAKKLDMLAAINPSHHLTRAELEQVIADSKEAIAFYENMIK